MTEKQHYPYLLLYFRVKEHIEVLCFRNGYGVHKSFIAYKRGLPDTDMCMTHFVPIVDISTVSDEHLCDINIGKCSGKI